MYCTASKLRKAGVFSRVDDSNTSIGKRYARNDELGTPYGITIDFACTSLLSSSPEANFVDVPIISCAKPDDDTSVSFSSSML